MFAYNKLTQMDGNNETQLIDLIYDLSTNSWFMNMILNWFNVDAEILNNYNTL